MPTYSITFEGSQGTGHYVSDDLFGANALHDINLGSEVDFAPSEGFQDALETNDIRNLRYPGGHVENTIDVTYMPNGELRPEVRDFLDWCVANSLDGVQYQVTFVLPTKVDIPAEQITAFVEALLTEYGDIIGALEIGNEYSIGVEVENPDRSVHPEFIEGSDFIPAMNETEYGIMANKVINAVQDALDNLFAADPLNAPDPAILLQMAETNGSASDYKGGEDSGNYDLANEAIISWLDDRAIQAVDGAVVHYYYNIDRVDSAVFSDDEWRQVRRIDERFANFEEQLGKDLDLYITEWNVLAGNLTQHGASSASILLEMFEFMVRMDTSDAYIWPLQHRTANSVMGDRDSSGVEYSMGGAVFSMMMDNLRPWESSIGPADVMESMSTQWMGEAAEVEINHFSSPYRDVFYVSLRSDIPSTVDIDISSMLQSGDSVEVTRLTIDPESSDGLSDYANEDGGERIPRRVINQEELDQLETLAFFDPKNANHVKISNGEIMTYLPPYETIIPLVDNPQSIDDYYFTSEADVEPLIMILTTPSSDSGELSLDLLPFDVVMIVVEHELVFEGGNDGDYLVGGAGRDVMLGRLGNDVLIAGEGDDLLKGGWGNDQLYGGEGNDSLVGSDGNDKMSGGATLFGNDPGDVNSGDDTLDGGEGNDTMNGRDGNDTLYGDVGHDRMFGGDGNDRLFGGEGADFIWGQTGNDRLNGGLGYDFLFGGDGDDTILGEDQNDRLFGEDGNDVLNGGRGTDTLYGGSGDDSIAGGDNADRLSGGDTMFGSKPGDLNSGNDTLDGGAGNDTLSGRDGNDSLNGGDHNDRLFGGTGDDTMHGDDGADFLWGKADNDVLTGGNGADSMFGGFGDDSLQGDSGDDKLSGGETFFGKTPGDLDSGNDTLDGGAGNDTLNGHDGNDSLLGGADNDRLFGGTGDDALFGGDGNDFLWGQSGNDHLDGGAGSDFLHGGSGDDTLTGGAGTDTFIFYDNGGNDTISDFENGLDRIDLRGLSTVSTWGDLDIRQVSGGTEIDLGEDILFLTNIQASDIDVNDFLL
ncbi:calcium-binding protein [Primorskyibacter sp. 2E233]|uniref:calcium-binding protein n=1 Tax=Primorskyibacter sp. 2E233 TaxID=3413431 RepID=UPI003BF1CB94